MIKHPIKAVTLVTLIVTLTSMTGCATKLPTPDLSKLPPPPQLNRIPPIPQLAALFKKRQANKTSNKLREEALAKLPITHPLRKEKFFEAWNSVGDRTRAIPLSDRRLRITTSNDFLFQAKTPLLNGENLTEQNFFIRASAETMRAGYDGFAVVHIDYFSPGVQLFSLTPNYNFSSQRWIGTYEDFLQNRNEQNMFSSRRKVENKAMDGIIIMLNDEDRPNRKRFSADEIYQNLLNYRSQ